MVSEGRKKDNIMEGIKEENLEASIVFVDF